jgi:hypothetical protein
MLSIDYATDQEWSRYLVFNSILWAALVGFLVGDFLNVRQELKLVYTKF